MYIVLLKENIAVATAMCNNIDEIKDKITLYDNYEEINEKTFNTIPLPSVFEGGKWVKTDKATKVNYPPIKEEQTPTGNNSVYDELAEAYRKGVQEA